MPHQPFILSQLSRRTAALAASLLLLVPGPVGGAAPGGPLFEGGPKLGIPGTPLTWDPAAMPIHYRVDPGPMATDSSGTVVIDNAAGLARMKSMYDTWGAVPTALLSFNNDGPLLPSGSYTGGPVAGNSGISNFNALQASCRNGEQSPVIFDPNGNLFSQLGLSFGVIGFAFPCDFDASGGHIKTVGIALNGQFQNGGSHSILTTDEFNQAITHEIGHFLGLDHSQINVEVLNEQPLHCNPDDAAGLPLMFPIFICQARVTSGLPALAPDDAAWISHLYPVTASPVPAGKQLTSQFYGTIGGTIFFSDALTAAQGVNVIAREADNSGILQNQSRRVAFSAVSGYRFTGNPGQTVTCQDPKNPSPATCTNPGSSFGSHDPALIGTFEIPVIPGSYTLTVESIDPHFGGGSSVGPLRLPILMPGSAPSPQQVTVSAGGSVSVSITLVGTPPRFDAFETSEWHARYSLWPWQRRERDAGQAVSR